MNDAEREAAGQRLIVDIKECLALITGNVVSQVQFDTGNSGGTRTGFSLYDIKIFDGFIGKMRELTPSMIRQKREELLRDLDALETAIRIETDRRLGIIAQGLSLGKVNQETVLERVTKIRGYLNQL